MAFRLFLRILCLLLLLSFLFVGSVGASAEMWSQTYGGEFIDHATSLVQTSDGGYALAGKTQSFGAGTYDDVLLVKTDDYGIVPEFHSWTPLLTMLVIVIGVAAVYRLRLAKNRRMGK